jgi:hypothetical protein
VVAAQQQRIITLPYVHKCTDKETSMWWVSFREPADALQGFGSGPS